MHYPVMTEKHVADRWQVSLKTLRRWRLDGEGPVWHKLFRHVRYHEADVLEFEHSSAQHLMTLLGIKRDFKPEVPEAAQGLDAKAEDNYFTAKEIAESSQGSRRRFSEVAVEGGRQPPKSRAGEPDTTGRSRFRRVPRSGTCARFRRLRPQVRSGGQRARRKAAGVAGCRL